MQVQPILTNLLSLQKMQNLAGVQAAFKLIIYDTPLLGFANSSLIAVSTQALPFKKLR